MIMKFNRLALIKAAQDEIDAQADAARADADKTNAKRRADGDAWISQYREPWLLTLSTIWRKLKAGTPIYASDLPQRREWRTIAVFDDAPKKPATAWVPEAGDLRNLIATLSAVGDDDVTTSGLAAIGISSRALRSTIQRLGRTEQKGTA